MIYITIPLLNKYNADAHNIKLFAGFYPDGANMDKIIRDGLFSIDFIYWMLNFLPLENDDLDRCYAELQIQNCNIIKNSCKCINSSRIFGSHDVQDSNLIYYSSSINKSSKCCRSRNVDNSSECVDSNSIINSNRIFMSNNITDSSEIARSTFITKSIGVIDSQIISDSSMIRKSSSIKDSIFCAECKNLKNSFGCFKVDDAENLVFNQPAPVELIEMLKNSFYQLKASNGFKVADIWKENKSIPPNTFYDFRKCYNELDESFFEWLKQCPLYNDTIKYYITMM